jgi:hypothetical protein
MYLFVVFVQENVVQTEALCFREYSPRRCVQTKDSHSSPSHIQFMRRARELKFRTFIMKTEKSNKSETIRKPEVRCTKLKFIFMANSFHFNRTQRPRLPIKYRTLYFCPDSVYNAIHWVIRFKNAPRTSASPMSPSQKLLRPSICSQALSHSSKMCITSTWHVVIRCILHWCRSFCPPRGSW